MDCDLFRIGHNFIVSIHKGGPEIDQNVDDEHHVDGEIDVEKRICRLKLSW